MEARIFMVRASGRTGTDRILEAPSVRKDETFRVTKTGLERLQSSKLRNGGKHHRIDELPYHRIASLSYEEKVTTRGSKTVTAVGIILLLFGLGLPALTGVVSMLSLQVQGARISGLTDSLAIPNLAGVAIGIALLATKFPRRTSEGWWQVRGEDLSHEDQRGWQVAAGQKGTDELVRAIREGIALSARPTPTKNP